MSRLDTSRFIVGLGLIAVAVGLLLFAEGDASRAGVIGLSVLGIVMIAISRRKARLGG